MFWQRRVSACFRSEVFFVPWFVFGFPSGETCSYGRVNLPDRVFTLPRRHLERRQIASQRSHEGAWLGPAPHMGASTTEASPQRGSCLLGREQIPEFVFSVLLECVRARMSSGQYSRPCTPLRDCGDFSSVAPSGSPAFPALSVRLETPRFHGNEARARRFVRGIQVHCPVKPAAPEAI